MTRAKVFNALAVTFSVMIFCVAAAYFWSAYLEKPYLSYKNLPFPTTGKVPPGERLAVSVERCNRHQITEAYSTTHGIRNEATQQIDILPNIEVTVEPGCHLDDSKINVVPEKQAPGFYTFFGVATVRGLLVDHQVRWNSETFQVIEKDQPVIVIAPIVKDAP